MSSETTNPLHETAIAAATRQANGFSATLTLLAVIASVAWLGWSAAHTYLGAPVVPVGVARLTVFLSAVWVVFNMVTALINHTILTGYRVGIETLALTAAGVVSAMQQAQAKAEAAPAGSDPIASSPVTYLHEAILRRAQDAATPSKDA